MNAPVNAAFANILTSICPPAKPAQPQVKGSVLATISYDGLMLDVLCDAEGDYSGIALKGRRECLCGVLADSMIDEIERMAEQAFKAAA